MKLPPHLSCKIDYLIPDEIIDACCLDQFDIELVVYGHCAGNLFPAMRIWINDGLVWQGTVTDQQTIKVQQSLDINQQQVQLRIEYHGKDDQTCVKVDEQGNIVENQFLSIKALIINGINLMSNQSIYNFGKYYMTLSSEKQKYFLEHNHDIHPNHSLDMYENGEWRLDFGVPVTRFIAKTVSPQRSQIKWPDNDLLINIIEKCDRIEQLQKKLAEKDLI